MNDLPKRGLFEAADATWTDRLADSVDSAAAPFADWFATIIFYPVTLGEVSFPFVVAWLITAGLVATIYFGFIQFRGMSAATDTVKGKYSASEDPGEVTHFQALTSALSGTVGLGNIAGVGAAVALGGPGATFWMILAGLLGMATKFAECTLGVKYRKINEDGTVDGGPFQYLPIAFKWMTPIPAKIITGLFAVSILMFGLGGGNMFQANQTYAQVVEVTGKEDSFLNNPGGALATGLLLAGAVALVIIGGMKSVGKVTSKLVPAMGGMYFIACLIVIVMNIGQVPDAFVSIFEGAFKPEGISGGILGVVIVGFQRAAFSNEAGLGSAPIAHSTVKTTRPVSEGFVALFEPLADTVIICTMTALTIIIANPQQYIDSRASVAAGDGALDGVVVTSGAFETVIPWFPILLAIAVGLFAFSTAITWAYYSERAWSFLFPANKISITVFRVLYCAFIVVGCLMSFTDVMTITDSALFLCGFINLLGVYFLLPKVKEEMVAYLRDRKEGRLLVPKGERAQLLNPEETQN